MWQGQLISVPLFFHLVAVRKGIPLRILVYGLKVLKISLDFCS